MKPYLMSVRSDVSRFNLQEQQYAIQLANQVDLAGVIVLRSQRTVTDLNGEATLP